jgi:hypothetical protein
MLPEVLRLYPSWYIVIDSSNGHLQIYLLLSINLLIRG